MSFVITVVRPDAVVQVSETRLSSLPDKSLVCDDQRKSIVVVGEQVRFVLGWIGLARTDSRHDTSVWLRRQLCGMNAAELPLVQIAVNLKDLAGRHFVTLKVSAPERRCEFVLGGWHKVSGVPVPFTCVISNDPTFTSGGDASPEFMYSITSFRPVVAPFLVTVIGDFDSTALMSHFKGLKGLLKRRSRTLSIRTVCRQIVLEAARQRVQTVGSNLIAVQMDNEGAAECFYYPEGDQEEMLVPDILSTRGALAARGKNEVF